MTFLSTRKTIRHRVRFKALPTELRDRPVETKIARMAFLSTKKTKIGHRVRFEALLKLFEGKRNILNSVSNPYKLNIIDYITFKFLIRANSQ